MGEQIRRYEMIPLLSVDRNWDFCPQAIPWPADMPQVEKP